MFISKFMHRIIAISSILSPHNAKLRKSKRSILHNCPEVSKCTLGVTILALFVKSISRFLHISNIWKQFSCMPCFCFFTFLLPKFLFLMNFIYCFVKFAFSNKPAFHLRLIYFLKSRFSLRLRTYMNAVVRQINWIPCYHKGNAVA